MTDEASEEESKACFKFPHLFYSFEENPNPRPIYPFNGSHGSPGPPWGHAVTQTDRQPRSPTPTPARGACSTRLLLAEILEGVLGVGLDCVSARGPVGRAHLRHAGWLAWRGICGHVGRRVGRCVPWRQPPACIHGMHPTTTDRKHVSPTPLCIPLPPSPRRARQ